MDQSQQRLGLWAQPNVPRPPSDTTYGRRLADMLASYWDDPAPGGLVEMAKSVVQGVRTPGRVLSGAYTVTPEVSGQWSEADEFRAQHARQQMQEDASALGEQS